MRDALDRFRTKVATFETTHTQRTSLDASTTVEQLYLWREEFVKQEAALKKDKSLHDFKDAYHAGVKAVKDYQKK